MTTPQRSAQQRLRDAYGDPDGPDLKRDASIASTFRPDPGMEQLAALPSDEVPRGLRMALGFYLNAKAATARVSAGSTTTPPEAA